VCLVFFKLRKYFTKVDCDVFCAEDVYCVMFCFVNAVCVAQDLLRYLIFCVLKVECFKKNLALSGWLQLLRIHIYLLMAHIEYTNSKRYNISEPDTLQ
jgi:hypothetical protein